MPKIAEIDQAWDFHGCSKKTLSSPKSRAVLERYVRDSGFTVKDSAFHQFSGGGGGFSLAVIIGESDVTFSTWPERGLAIMTLKYCNYTEENSEKAEKLFGSAKSYFNPRFVVTHRPRTRGKS